MVTSSGRGLVLAGGICVALWVLLGQAFFAAFPLAAGGTMLPRAGGLDAVPSKFSLGLEVPTNLVWTALGYILWPLAVGISLLRSPGAKEGSGARAV